jgi:hypothetical protein
MGSTVGVYDSSRTRVSPVFERLVARPDDWLSILLTLPRRYDDGCAAPVPGQVGALGMAPSVVPTTAATRSMRSRASYFGHSSRASMMVIALRPSDAAAVALAAADLPQTGRLLQQTCTRVD